MRHKNKLHPIGTLFGSFVIVLVLVFAVANMRASTVAAADGDGEFTVLKAGEIDEATLAGLQAGWRTEKDGESAIYLIRLEDEPVATYRGSLSGLAATSPSATGQRAVDLDSDAVLAYRQHLKSERASFVSNAQSVLGRNLDVVYEYEMANNGLAVRLTPKEAAQVATLPGVEYMQRDKEYELHTDNGPAWIGAPGIWDGTNSNAVATKGEGVVVGVIDTGINYSNPSFAEVGPEDAYDHVSPLGEDNFLGDCAPGGDYTDYCNDKLIGVRGYPTVNGGDPVDYDGHGSHTASTAAGNEVEAPLIAPTKTITRTISGVAPHANIIAYSACCTLSALSAAIDDIVTDYATITDADEDARMVVNYSIGSTSPTPDMWNDFDTAGYLAAREAGIFVATSAGNSGPGANTVGSPADAPWLTSVGASTHDRSFINTVSFSGGDTGLADIVGKSITDGYGPAEIVFAGDVDGDGQCLEPFPENTWDGEIVVCIRGEIARVDKGANVLAGGAGGLILANDEASGDSLNGDPHYLPAVHITYDDGQDLLDWLTEGDDHEATILGTTVDENAANGDIMAAFSSRGANGALGDIIVPSVTAPGVDILAAYGTDNAEEWNAISGTSMASPHVAGAAALMMAVHPDWTPAEVQSALMTTAWTDVLKEDGTTDADPFDMGAGRVDLSVAAQAGLVLDESIEDYENANPDEGGDPKTLNLPSMGDDECLLECSWTREVRSTSLFPVEWAATATGDGDLSLSVEPASFTLGPDETKLITVTADVSAIGYDAWTFGEVTLTPSLPAPADSTEDVAAPEGVALPPAAHLPVAVKSTPVTNLPDLVAVYGADETGEEAVEDVEAIASDDLTAMPYGLKQAALFETYVNQDPTNLEPFDQLGNPGYGTYVVVATIGEDGARRLVAEIVDTTSYDLDLFVYHVDTATFPCLGQTASAYEYCSVADPVEGTYYIIVQNWAGSTYFEDPLPGPGESHLFDRIEFTAAIIDEDSENLTVTADPANVAAFEPFDLDVAWDLDGSNPGTYWYGLFDLIGGTGGNDIPLGTVDVDVHRAPYTVDGEGDFTFPGTAGTTVTIDVPEGALGVQEWLAYEPHNVVRAGSHGLQARGYGFELVPYDADGYNPGFDFNGESLTVTIDYSSSPALAANAASLMYWDLAALSWSSDGITVVDRDFENQQLVLEVDHLTEFGLLGSQMSLPVITITEAN